MSDKPSSEVLAKVCLDGTQCGTIGRSANGKYVFTYATSYRNQTQVPLSLSLPLSKQEHWTKSTDLHPYFLNLIPEGWLLKIALELKTDRSSPIALLTSLCHDNIGAAEVFKADEPQAVPGPCEIPAAAQVKDVVLPKHRRCLLCHQHLPSEGHNRNYHEPCAKLLFGVTTPPILSFKSKDIRTLASNQLGSGHAVTGVQQKLSGLLRGERNTMVLPGRFILKPQPADPLLTDMVRLEVGMMHFAQYLGLRCAPTGLLYAIDGNPALLSVRFDRDANGRKLHCEDMAQALSVDPGNKYGGTLERVADVLSSLRAPTDSVLQGKTAFFEVTLYNFLMGNADNHLKNFSIAHFEVEGELVSRLAPFYDLVPARLFPTGDTEETGLSLAGKKRSFKQVHFAQLTERLSLSADVMDHFLARFKKGGAMLRTIFESLHVPSSRIDELETFVAARLEDIS